MSGRSDGREFQRLFSKWTHSNLSPLWSAKNLTGKHCAWTEKWSEATTAAVSAAVSHCGRETTSERLREQKKWPQTANTPHDNFPHPFHSPLLKKRVPQLKKTATCQARSSSLPLSPTPSSLLSALVVFVTGEARLPWQLRRRVSLGAPPALLTLRSFTAKQFSSLCTSARRYLAAAFRV